MHYIIVGTSEWEIMVMQSMENNRTRAFNQVKNLLDLEKIMWIAVEKKVDDRFFICDLWKNQICPLDDGVIVTIAKNKLALDLCESPKHVVEQILPDETLRLEKLLNEINQLNFNKNELGASLAKRFLNCWYQIDLEIKRIEKQCDVAISIDMSSDEIVVYVTNKNKTEPLIIVKKHGE